MTRDHCTGSMAPADAGRTMGADTVEGSGAPAAETPAQHGERRSAEALDAARRTLEEDPTVREMKTRFGATLHPESVRPTE